MYETIDVMRCPGRRVSLQSVVAIFDFGPPETETDRRAAWLRESGGGPVQVNLESVDAREWLLRNPRQFRPTSTSPEMETQQTEVKATTQVINLVAASGVQLGGLWLERISTGIKYCVFSPDYISWQSYDPDYRPTTPSA